MHQYENAIQFDKKSREGLIEPPPQTILVTFQRNTIIISFRTVRIYESLQHSQVHSNPSRDNKQKHMFIHQNIKLHQTLELGYNKLKLTSKSFC